jgi:DNA-binding transcriptional ArsR family regulator
MPESDPTIPASFALSLEQFTKAIGTPTRWRVLAELSKGQPLMVIEIARAIGRKDVVVSKHLAVLRKIRAVEIGRGRMYQIVAPFFIAPGILDFGYGRLNMAGPQR